LVTTNVAAFVITQSASVLSLTTGWCLKHKHRNYR